jgi:hypothetical protein
MRAVLTGSAAQVVLCLLALVACGWDDDEDSSPRPRTVTALSHAPASQAKGKAPAPLIPQEILELEPRAADDEAKAEEEEEPERDYSAELRNAFGSPLGCLRQRTAAEAPSELAIELSATVMTGGNISRSDVSSAQLEAEELRCLESQLETRRLPGEVEDAPRSVQATITLQMKKPKTSGE